MKTTKGGKVMNPTDAYRKELRKKELKRNKKERKKVREVGILKKDPETIKEQIDKLEMMKADGALDKARKHKKRQLEDTLNLVIKKRKEYEDKLRDKGEASVMFSHLGPPRRRTTAEEDDRVNHPKPEDSVYYHPTLNPTGAPPPGKPPMYKSSIGPRIPLSSSSAEASSSKSEPEDGSLTVPPPPPPPPLPGSDEPDSVDVSGAAPPSIPLPPPPPIPPKPTANSSTPLPPPPIPPPPPGPPRESAPGHIPLSLPPPPPTQRPIPPAPPGTAGREPNKNGIADGIHLKESERATAVLPPPPPPPGLTPKPKHDRSEASLSENNSSSGLEMKDSLKTMSLPPPPPPPPRQPPPMPHRLPVSAPSHPDMLPPGIARYPPPPPPPDMRPPLPVTGIPSHLPPPPPPPGMIPLSMVRPPFPGPPGLPGALRPLTSGLPFNPEDDLGTYKPVAPQKPSYIKSAASTVVKRPLAQHTPELTAMVPASVRVRRETALQKTKPKPTLSASTTAPRPSVGPVVASKTEAVAASSAPKGQSIDDSYMAFLEDMKALGALDN